MNEQPLLLDNSARGVKPTAPTHKRVLFVDDGQNILDGIKRTLYGMRAEWEMAFSASGEEALKTRRERV